MRKLKPLEKSTLPEPPLLKKLLGPGFILLGLGIGSGELVLWPHLATNFGLGILWGALLGITFQFFINMEIERYTLTKGESVFVGLARKVRMLPLWFILSTLVPWMWPGIIGSGAVLWGNLFGIENTRALAIILLLVIGAILTLGPVLYSTEETVQKFLIIASVPFIFGLAIFLARGSDWQSLAQGLVGKGEGYWFLPAGIPLASFLAALAYAGAGGNLNLGQSLYIKEKGYGMGKYSGRITSLLTGKEEDIKLEGTAFDCTPDQVNRFKHWWKLINIEHALVFWLTGAVTILLLSLLAFTTVFSGETTANITFIVKEAGVIGARTIPIIGSIFLFVGGALLFSTQLGVLDTTSRIMTENLALTLPVRFGAGVLRRTFYLFLWLQILLGILVFVFDLAQPLTLIIIGASLNAVAMFVYIGLMLWLNLTSLERQLRPPILRIGVMFAAFLFFGGFSLFTFLEILGRA